MADFYYQLEGGYKVYQSHAYRYPDSKVETDPPCFTGEILIKSYFHRERAIWWECEAHGVAGWMYLKDLALVLQKSTIKQGAVHGTWQMRAKGKGFGLIMVGWV